MNAIRHTPGPWRFDTSGLHSKYIAKLYPIGSDGKACGPAFASLHIGRQDIQQANAKLIEQAPALLALARQYASECLECSGTGRCDLTGHDCDDCADIREIIAKAAQT